MEIRAVEWKWARLFGLVCLAVAALLCGSGPKKVFAQTPRYHGILPNSASTGVSLGSDFACALGLDGEVRCWGDNSRGQLGRGTTSAFEASAARVVNLDEVISVAAGAEHACALRRDGTIWCWGANDYGQIGDGSSGEDKNLPTKVAGLGTYAYPALSVVAGIGFTCALDAYDEVWCWGDNSAHQLGVDGDSSSATPIQLTTVEADALFASGHSRQACALTDSSGVQCWGSISTSPDDQGTDPTTVTGLSTDVVLVSSAYTYACALLASGQAQCWGDNSYGQLGQGDTASHGVVTVKHIEDATELSTGDGHACVRESDGSYQCWGENDHGELGISTSGPPVTDPAETFSASGIWTHVYAGGSFTCGATAGQASPDSEPAALQCWGDNTVGQLGDASLCSGGTCSSASSPAGSVLAGTGINLVGGESLASDFSSSCVRLNHRS
jgi:alpha-tubulin suppressor-like RCC1 family protein